MIQDTNFAIARSSWAVRFWCYWRTPLGEQTVVRVVRLGWVH